jgi:hypothetical protein
MKFRIDLAPPAPWPADAGPSPVRPLAAREAEAELRAVREQYDRRRHLDRLAPDELREMVTFQVGAEDLEWRRDYFRTTPLEKTFQGQVIPIIDALVEMDPTIRSVMNVGVRYAFADHALAARHPGVRFIGVDFMPDLAKMNREFARDNLSFVSGYALDLLAEGRARADVVFFSSTALTINNAELRRYARLIAARCRYVVFNEVLHHCPDGTLVNPLDLPVDDSAPVRRQPARGHAPLNVVHNYKAVVEEAGFSVLHYRVTPFPPFEPYRLELVAVKDVEFTVDPRLPWSDELGALEARDAARRDRDRLSPEELAETVAFQVAVEDLPFRRGHFRDTPLHLTIQGQAVPLVEAIIRQDRGVRSVMDIGVRYAYIDALLAAKFPDVEFVGIDFMPNLRELNADFTQANLRFVTGYALELLEQDRLRADVAVMVDTALTINNLELRRYFRLLAERTRYVVIDDPLHRSPGGGVEDPLSLDVGRSLPVYTPPVKITTLPGPLCYRHNYKAMLEEAGFDVMHYKVFRLGHYDLSLVTVVARRNA